MSYPRPGQFIEVEVGEWPTESHVLRAAQAIDVLSYPRIGDILRAVVAGIDKGGVDKPHPWDDAEPGALWLMVARDGKRHPVVRSAGGWRTVSRRKELFPSSHFTSGYPLWAEKPYPIDSCPNTHNHGLYPQCGMCAFVPESPDARVEDES